MKKILDMMWSSTTGQVNFYVNINEKTDKVTFKVTQEIKEIVKVHTVLKYSKGLSIYNKLSQGGKL